MKLSSASLTAVTAKPSIIEHIDFLNGTDSNSYPLADKLRNINIWYDKVVTQIIAVSNSGWKWDDSNYSNLPNASTTMIADQKDYTLPPAVSGNDLSTFLTFEKATVLDPSGKEQTLFPFLGDEAELNRVYATSGLPKYYKLIGTSIKVWPAPAAASTTLTAGLTVYYTRTPDLFTTSDTTQEPGFPAVFHEILAIGAAYEFASARGKDNKNELKWRLYGDPQVRDDEGLFGDLRSFYVARNQDKQAKPAMRTKHSSFN